jgi:hypothetical protein
MESNPTVDNQVMQDLETALGEVRRILAKLETPDGNPIDYQAWSEAKGSVLGKILEAQRLESRFVKHCQVVPSRYDILPLLPSGGCVAEIGTQYGQFAGHIARTCRPDQLHLFDLSFKQFDASLVEREKVPFVLHEGDSSKQLTECDNKFNWAYLDADHSYEGVKRDLMVLKDKILPGGIIICNDYTPWSPLEACIYGIPKAVHEFCKSEGWGFRYLALHRWGYHDVALQRLTDLH